MSMCMSSSMAQGPCLSPECLRTDRSLHVATPGAPACPCPARRRVRYDYSYVEALQSQINSLKAQLVTGAARQLKGSGSSAVSAFLWRLMGAMAARSATPVSMVYRATGSGTGAVRLDMH